MKRALLLLFAGLALILTACGGKTLDTAKVETDIQDIVKAASGGGVEAVAKCPDEVSDIKTGKTYDCTVTYAAQDGNEQTVQMKISNDDGESDFADQDTTTTEIAVHALVARDHGDAAISSFDVSGDTATIETDSGTLTYQLDNQGTWQEK